MEPEEPEEPELEGEPFRRLSDDLKRAAATLTDREARYLVDAYYAMQDYRIQSEGIARSAEKFTEPHDVVSWFSAQSWALEQQIKGALGIYAKAHRAGRWALSQHGIGPVLAAGLLAHIDIRKASTAGKIWRFAGLDPTAEWSGREAAKAWIKAHEEINDEEELLAIAAVAFKRKPDALRRMATFNLKDPGNPKDLTRDGIEAALCRRPWNARLKVLCWKIGESFKKQSASPKCHYGHVYRERKAREVEGSESGKFRDLAVATLGKKNYRKSETKDAYLAGKLPDGRLDYRATRYATKLFLSHWHWVLHESVLGCPPPKPYVVEHLGHAELLSPPGWPCE